MSFLATNAPPATPIYKGGTFGSPNLSYAVDMSPYAPFPGNMPDLVASGSVVGNVERLVYTSPYGGYIHTLMYRATGLDIQNVRIRIMLDGVTFIDANGSTPGIAQRGGVLVGGLELNPGFGFWGCNIPFRTMQIYMTTQFIDANAIQAIFGNISFVSSI